MNLILSMLSTKYLNTIKSEYLVFLLTFVGRVAGRLAAIWCWCPPGWSSAPSSSPEWFLSELAELGF